MLIKIVTYSCLLFSGKSKQYFRRERERFNLKGYVDIHHIIPRQFKSHEVIQNCKYDIENGYNLMLLPNGKAINNIKLNPCKAIHEYGHYKYNIFVKEYLDILLFQNNYSYLDLIHLNKFLKKNVKHLKIPWN